MKYIASCSFGKDSLAMLITIIEKGFPLDEIVYCEVMATPTTSAEFPEMVEFIEQAEKILKDKYNVKVKHIRADLSFEEQFYKIKQKGKFTGTYYGFPMTLRAWCNDRLKMKVIDKYFKSQGEHIRYIGIAADEPKRLLRLEDNEKAPLAELGITEKMALDICKENDLLSPLYSKFDRLGCWFCPKQNLKSLRTLKNDYPKLWEQLLEWQKDSNVPFKLNAGIFDLEKRFELEKEFLIQGKSITNKEFYNTLKSL